MKNMNIDKKGTLRTKGAQVVAYADDILIMAKQRSILEKLLTEIEREGESMGLKINMDKTKFMKIGRRMK